MQNLYPLDIDLEDLEKNGHKLADRACASKDPDLAKLGRDLHEAIAAHRYFDCGVICTRIMEKIESFWTMACPSYVSATDYLGAYPHTASLAAHERGKWFTSGAYTYVSDGVEWFKVRQGVSYVREWTEEPKQVGTHAPHLKTQD